MGGLIRLDDRAVVSVSGAEAGGFLHGIITNSVADLADGRAVYAGLLTPQGKLLFDFFIVRSGETFLVDIAKTLTADFLKRLGFYRLRAKVDLRLIDTALVCADLAGDFAAPRGAIAFDDPRLPSAGRRVLVLEAVDKLTEQANADDNAWLQHRLVNGLPEGTRDFTYGDCFPHDIAMDLLNGVAFNKGCYVGQEVVSRMRHRGTARRRPMHVRGDAPLAPAPAEITAGGKVIGTVGSALGQLGLAEIRLDFAEQVLAEGGRFELAGQPVHLERPRWASYAEQFPLFSG